MRPLPFHVKYRITNRFRIRLRNGDRQGVISCMFSVKPLLKNGDEVILSEFSNDTVFSYGKEGAKPLLVRTPAPPFYFSFEVNVSFKLQQAFSVFGCDRKCIDGISRSWTETRLSTITAKRRSLLRYWSIVILSLNCRLR